MFQIFNAWGVLSIMVSSKKLLDKITHTIVKALSSINKHHGTTAMSMHVSLKHHTMLDLYKAQKLATTIVSLDAQQSSKKQKNTTHSILNFFKFAIPYKNLMLFKNNSWRICICMSPKGTTYWMSPKTFSLRGLSFDNGGGLHFQTCNS
jgi:hypothetical protein